MPRRLNPPLRGAANNTAMVDTPESFCPPANLRNVRPYGSGAQERPLMGPRPGLIKAFAAQLGGGSRIQALEVVGRASGVSGYEPGEINEVDGGVSRTAGALAGCCWALDSQRGMFADFGTGFAYQCAWHPTLRRVAYFIITTNSASLVVTRVRLCDADTTSGTFGTDLWETDIEDADPGATPGSFPIYGNHLLVTATFTYVCAGPWLYVLRTSDGEYLQRYSMMGWAGECMGACVRQDGKLAVAFKGTQVVTGPVTTIIADTGAGNGEGSHFRSGVMLFTVDSTATDVDDDMLAETQFGTKKTNAYAYFEDHLYWRTSEHVAMQPRGRYCNSVAALPDGGIVVATCNKGWGPNSTFAPDSSVSRRCVIKISSAGVLEWESSAFFGNDEAYTGTWGTYYNDIPYPGKPDNDTNSPHPSADAIAVDPDGDIYVGGKQMPSNGTLTGYATLRKLRGTDGAVLWETDLGPWVAQNGLVYDTVNGVVVAVGKRTNAWEGASGAYAHLWFIDPATGEILASYDLAETGINAWGVGVSAFGDVAFATDKVL